MSDINYINQIARAFHNIDFDKLTKDKQKNKSGQKGSGQMAILPYKSNSFPSNSPLMPPKKRFSYSPEEDFDFSYKVNQLVQNPPTHLKPPSFRPLQTYSPYVYRSRSRSQSPSLYQKNESLLTEADIEFMKYQKKALLNAGYNVPDDIPVSRFIKQEAEKKGKAFLIKVKILTMILFFAFISIIYYFIKNNPIPGLTNILKTMPDGTKTMSLKHIAIIILPIWSILTKVLPPILIKFGIHFKNAVTPYLFKALYFLVFKILLFVPIQIIDYLGQKDTLFRKLFFYPGWTIVKSTSLITQTLKGLGVGINASISFIIQIFEGFTQFIMLLM